MAFVVAVLMWAFSSEPNLARPEIVFGILGGIGWFTAYLLLDMSIRLAGVTIAQCVGWLGVSVPVAASILFWGEIPNASQCIGMGTMVLALFLLTPGKTSNVARKSKWRVPVLLGLFAAEGGVAVAMKAFSETASESRTSGLLVFMFMVAGLGSTVTALLQGRRISAGDIAHGGPLGIVAVLANYTLVVAIGRLDGVVVFPVFWAGTILLVSISAMILWRERYSVRAMIGMMVALLTVIFVSMDVPAMIRGMGL